MDSRLRGNDRVFFPGIGEVGQWIPAFAGMTECFSGHWGGGTMDSRLRGNDGVFFPSIGEVGQWIPAFAGMTECFSQALGRWDNGFPPSRE